MTQLTRYKLPLGKLTQFSPQLVQEIKARINFKNILATLVAGIVWQFTIVVLALGKLPDLSSLKYLNLEDQEQFSRYCTGAITHLQPPQQQLFCLQDLRDHWLINWRLFWFDIFTIISVISIFLLIIGCTYLSLASLNKDIQQGTLRLINFAPQPASQFFIGKILGVPILLYIFLALSLPLHLIAGLQAGIPLALIITFYLATIASCVFFFGLGFFFVYQPTLNKYSETNNHRVTIITVVIAAYLLLTACLNHDSGYYFGNVADWLILCNPLNLIIYLGQITAIPSHYFNYENLSFFSAIFSNAKSAQLGSFQAVGLGNVSIYGQSLRHSIGLGLGLVTANFLLGAYWFWQTVKRRFYNPEQSPISKSQSYWLSFQVSTLALGLTLNTNHKPTLINNFSWLSGFLIIYALILIVSLSPSYYQFQDWLYNRQREVYAPDNFWQTSNALNPNFYNHAKYSLWQDLIFGGSSPSNLAIFLNLLIIACCLTPAIIIFLTDDQALFALSRLILQLNLIFLFATLWQWLSIHFQRIHSTTKSLVLLGVFVPVAISTSSNLLSAKMITGFIPLSFSFIAQWLAIILITAKTMKMLRANTKQLNNHP